MNSNQGYRLAASRRRTPKEHTMSSHQIIKAEDLYRNSRVILDLAEMPYLVDSAVIQPDGEVVVKFSNGDQRNYGPTEPVVIVIEEAPRSRPVRRPRRSGPDSGLPWKPEMS